MTTLYHHCCLHSAALIEADGNMLRPNWRYTAAPWLWLTDLEHPYPREALGLTMNTIRCDRTEATFKVTSPDVTPVKWMTVRRLHPQLLELEEAPGARPQHWWFTTLTVLAERVR